MPLICLVEFKAISPSLTKTFLCNCDYLIQYLQSKCERQGILTLVKCIYGLFHKNVNPILCFFDIDLVSDSYLPVGVLPAHCQRRKAHCHRFLQMPTGCLIKYVI